MFTVICKNVLHHTKYFVVILSCQERKVSKDIFSVILNSVKLASFGALIRTTQHQFFFPQKLDTDSPPVACLLSPWLVRQE